jgi:hypothetical protein
MGVNAMHIDDLNGVETPLIINQEAGVSLKIEIANSTIPASINVYLEDTIENSFTLLTNENFELLTQTTLSGMGRFFLHFTTSTLSTDTISSTSLLTAYKVIGNAYLSRRITAVLTASKAYSLQCIRAKSTFKKHPKPITERDAFYSRYEDRSLHPKNTGRKHCFH